MKASPGTNSRAMTVAGIMSGTSADGIDVALVRIRVPRNPSHNFPQLQLLAHVAVPYPAAVRKRILRMMNADAASVAEMSRLHWRLGQLYADAVKLALKNIRCGSILSAATARRSTTRALPGNFLGRRWPPRGKWERHL